MLEQVPKASSIPSIGGHVTRMRWMMGSSGVVQSAVDATAFGSDAAIEKLLAGSKRNRTVLGYIQGSNCMGWNSPAELQCRVIGETGFEHGWLSLQALSRSLAPTAHFPCHCPR